MIDPPLESDDEGELTDWLELIALYSVEKSAQLDLVVNAIEIADDSEPEDIAAADEANEALLERMTEEIRQRTESLSAEAYPYEISSNGETLGLRDDLTYGHKAYLSCLVISQSWSAGKLLPPVKLTDQELRDGREKFEILSAVAALGLSGGPSFLLGTNRAGAEGLLARIAEVCQSVKEGAARPELHDDAPEAANDDKVDVLAVEKENDGPPHRGFWFCQSAAGANYKDKPMKNEVERFLEIWFEYRPANALAAVFCPALLSRTEINYETRRLGQIFHRLRMPLHAQRGIELFEADAALLQYVEDTEMPCTWLDAYIERAAQAALQ